MKKPTIAPSFLVWIKGGIRHFLEVGNELVKGDTTTRYSPLQKLKNKLGSILKGNSRLALWY